jgi:hypothetical protein
MKNGNMVYIRKIFSFVPVHYSKCDKLFLCTQFPFISYFSVLCLKNQWIQEIYD